MTKTKDNDDVHNEKSFTGYFTGILIICGISYLFSLALIDYQHPGITVTLNVTGSRLAITRTEHLTLIGRGGNNLKDMYKSLGWMHAKDRYVQICIMRLASQGLLTTTFPYTESNYRFDVIARQFDFTKITEDNIKLYDQKGETIQILQAYTEGINEYMTNNYRPYEFMLVNYQPSPFTVSDIITFLRFISFVGLDEIALSIENFIIRAIRSDTVSPEFIQKSFHPHIENLTAEHIEMYKSIKEMKPRERASIIPAIVNSNNWVISGKISSSGMPIMSSDPHLDVIKQPNTFYEAQYIAENGVNVFGVTVPGLPIFLMGRNTNLSFTFTYGMMDMADYFVENIQNKHYERDGEFLPLFERKEIVADKEVIFYTTAENHIIERTLDNLEKDIDDGIYLAIRLADRNKHEDKLWTVAKLPFAKTVADAQILTPQSFLGMNFLFADIQGNIGYQQTGSVPLRPSSHGLLPLPAWNSSNLWTGYLSDEDYKRVINPPEEFIATANNYIQDPDKPQVNTYHALPTRVNRIREILKSKSNHSVEDMMRYQGDTFSSLAELTIPKIEKYLPHTGIGEELRKWDRRFQVDSRAAALWFEFWELLTMNVNGALFGHEISQDFAKSVMFKYTMIKLTINAVREGSFDGHNLEPILKSTIEQALNRYKDQVYGDVNTYFSKNIFFDGKLPRIFGMDLGPYPSNAGMEIIKIGATSTYNDEPCLFSQTWRFVTDMSSNVFYSILPGGPSGNYFSNIYGREIHNFINEEYKTWTL